MCTSTCSDVRVLHSQPHWHCSDHGRQCSSGCRQTHWAPHDEAHTTAPVDQQKGKANVKYIHVCAHVTIQYYYVQLPVNWDTYVCVNWQCTGYMYVHVSCAIIWSQTQHTWSNTNKQTSSLTLTYMYMYIHVRLLASLSTQQLSSWWRESVGERSQVWRGKLTPYPVQ